MSQNNNKIDPIYQKALSILDFSPQTEKNLMLKLIKRGYDPELVKEVICRLKDKCLLNDYEFAKVYADNLAAHKFYGRKMIVNKLKLKGLNKELADQLADEAISAQGGEEKILENYLQKNSAVINRLLKKDDLNKVKRKLYNSGFSEELIRKKMNGFKSSEPDMHEF